MFNVWQSVYVTGNTHFQEISVFPEIFKEYFNQGIRLFTKKNQNTRFPWILRSFLVLIPWILHELELVCITVDLNTDWLLLLSLKNSVR
jgi:hypothetical protein